VNSTSANVAIGFFGKLYIILNVFMTLIFLGAQLYKKISEKEKFEK
jgi:hypothetical protein